MTKIWQQQTLSFERVYSLVCTTTLGAKSNRKSLRARAGGLVEANRMNKFLAFLRFISLVCQFKKYSFNLKKQGSIHNYFWAAKCPGFKYDPRIERLESKYLLLTTENKCFVKFVYMEQTDDLPKLEINTLTDIFPCEWKSPFLNRHHCYRPRFLQDW